MNRRVKMLLLLLTVVATLFLATCKPMGFYLEKVCQAYGKATDARTGEPLESVQVSLGDYQISLLTNSLGDYEIPLAAGTWTLNFTRVGYVTASRQATVDAENQRVNVDVALESTVPRDGLAAEWLFSNKAFNDTSGNGHDCGNIGLSGDCGPTFDRFFKAPNRAFYFNVGWVAVNDTPLFFDPNGPFSISVWLNMADDTSLVGYDFIGQDEGGGFTDKWFLNIWPHDGIKTIGIFVGNESGEEDGRNSDPINMPLYTWHHIVVVRDGSTFRFYYDSQPAGSSTWDVVIPNVDSPLTIGFAEETQYWIGVEDDVRIYDRALTSVEVSELFHEGGWTGQ